MKQFLFIWLISLFLTTSAAADEYDGIYRDLVAAAYRHMETAYHCRTMIGLSRFHEARVTAENSLRLSGIPTDIAFQAVEQMVAKMQTAKPGRSRALSLTDCMINMRSTQFDLQARENRMRSYWHGQ